jgi:hypothetical protein
LISAWGLASLADPIVPEDHECKHPYNEEVWGELVVKKLSYGI